MGIAELADEDDYLGDPAGDEIFDDNVDNARVQAPPLIAV
jgi:hypothetical protein